MQTKEFSRCTSELQPKLSGYCIISSAGDVGKCRLPLWELHGWFVDSLFLFQFLNQSWCCLLSCVCTSWLQGTLRLGPFLSPNPTLPWLCPTFLSTLSYPYMHSTVPVEVVRMLTWEPVSNSALKFVSHSLNANIRDFLFTVLRSI